jgi:hypothetical protein
MSIPNIFCKIFIDPWNSKSTNRQLGETYSHESALFLPSFYVGFLKLLKWGKESIKSHHYSPFLWSLGQEILDPQELFTGMKFWNFLLSHIKNKYKNKYAESGIMVWQNPPNFNINTINCSKCIALFINIFILCI